MHVRKNDDHSADEMVTGEVLVAVVVVQVADLVEEDLLEHTEQVGPVQNLQDHLAGAMALLEAVVANHQTADQDAVLLEDPILQVLEIRIGREEINFFIF